VSKTCKEFVERFDRQGKTTDLYFACLTRMHFATLFIIAGTSSGDRIEDASGTVAFHAVFSFDVTQGRNRKMGL